jgi:hypothetical protein
MTCAMPVPTAEIATRLAVYIGASHGLYREAHYVVDLVHDAASILEDSGDTRCIAAGTEVPLPISERPRQLQRIVAALSFSVSNGATTTSNTNGSHKVLDPDLHTTAVLAKLIRKHSHMSGVAIFLPDCTHKHS